MNLSELENGLKNSRSGMMDKLGELDSGWM
jgi:hypothetical protein